MRRDPFAKDDVRLTSQVGGLRHFTDRENFTEAFHNRVHAPAGQPGRVLAFYGVGGIGKTTLAQKFCADLRSFDPPVPHAIVDIETLRDKVHADRETLIRFRTQLERDFRIGFPRFDLCLAVSIAREGGDPEPLVRINPLLRGVFDFALSLTSMPVPGAGLVEQLVYKFKLESWVRRAGGTEDVLRLRQCDDRELAGELMKKFAEDLRNNLPARAGKACRGVLFLDTYEALWSGREAAASAQARLADEWVRSLAEYCLAAGVLLAVLGRDRLSWGDADPDWETHLEQQLLGGLSYPDAQSLLARCGVGSETEREATALQDAIIHCCNLEARKDAAPSCHPLYLALCAEIVVNTRRADGAEPSSDFFRGIPSKQVASELADRFLRSLHNGAMQGWVEELSLTPRFDEEAALALDEGRRHLNGRKGWEELKHFSFVEPEAGGLYHLHKTMREVLRARVEEGSKKEVHCWFAAHWAARDRPALAWFHRWSVDPEERLNEWQRLHDASVKERNLVVARSILDWWADVALDEVDRAAMRDGLWGRTHQVLGYALWNTPVIHLSVALAASIQHFMAALRVYTEADSPADWAMTQNNLGMVYHSLPTGDRAANLAKAVACYEAALHVRTEAALPGDWAATQNNLGAAYWAMLSGNRAANLAKAVACYEAALRVRTEAAFPADWAMTQSNLGAAYRAMPSGDRAANLAKAIACYEAALRVRTEADFPGDWATTQNNLANAYSELPTGDRAANLAKAVACYEAALRVRSEADFPADWAMSQNNLGMAYQGLPTGDRAANLAKAVGCYQAALRVYTEAEFPRDWALAQINLGYAYSGWPTEDRAANLDKAVAYYEAALRVYTEADSPRDWAWTLHNLGCTCVELPTGDRAANLAKAVVCYEAALRVRTEADFPREWAATQINLGYAYSNLSTEGRAANLAKAVACYEAALRVYTEADFPRDWGWIQYNLGSAYSELPAGDRAANLAKAVAYYEAALRVYTEAALPVDWAATQNKRGEALRILYDLSDAPELLHRAREAFEAARRGFEATGLSAEAKEATAAAASMNRG